MIYNPSHPGEVLNEYLEGITVVKAARHLGVTRAALSRIIHGKASISPTMAIRLGKAFNNSPDYWLNLQRQYDLWQAQQHPPTNVKPLYL